MEELIKSIIEEAKTFSTNAEAQVNGKNKAAGLRARKSAIALIDSLKQFRKDSVAFDKK